jgi:hypothetical protein
MYHRQVLVLRPLGHPSHPSTLNSLGHALLNRFQQLGRMEDLEEAVVCHRGALSLCPHSHPNRCSSLHGLGNTLYAHFEQLGRMEDLDKAITYHRQGLALRPLGHLNRHASLQNLGFTPVSLEGCVFGTDFNAEAFDIGKFDPDCFVGYSWRG